MVTNVVIVEDKSEELSNLECTRTKAVQELQHMILCPSVNDMCHIVDHNIFGNNAFQCINVRNTKKIYKTSNPSLKQKSIKK